MDRIRIFLSLLVLYISLITAILLLLLNSIFLLSADILKKVTAFSNKATSLDATTVEKIFNRYYTVENAKKSTGIGLSIAKQLVELNGGTINAKYIKNHLIIEIIL